MEKENLDVESPKNLKIRIPTPKPDNNDDMFERPKINKINYCKYISCFLFWMPDEN